MVNHSCLSALIKRQQGLPAHSFANSAVRFTARACISSVLLASLKEQYQRCSLIQQRRHYNTGLKLTCIE